MTDREKLIWLLDKVGVGRLEGSFIADHLIANGVVISKNETTTQRWIPVTERLPECKQDALLCFDAGDMAVGCWYDRDECITFWAAHKYDGWYADCGCEPTHWMPLPEPPKG